jgi:hypothetical protein
MLRVPEIMVSVLVNKLTINYSHTLLYGYLYIPYDFYQDTHNSKAQAWVSTHSDEMVPTPIHPTNLKALQKQYCSLQILVSWCPKTVMG